MVQERTGSVLSVGRVMKRIGRACPIGVRPRGVIRECTRVHSRMTPQSVRMEGVEPPRLAAPDPKSGASANSATSAKGANIRTVRGATGCRFLFVAPLPGPRIVAFTP